MVAHGQPLTARLATAPRSREELEDPRATAVDGPAMDDQHAVAGEQLRDVLDVAPVDGMGIAAVELGDGQSPGDLPRLHDRTLPARPDRTLTLNRSIAR